MILSPVAFPSLALNLPEGGRSTTYQHYTLWSKEDIGNGLNRQFRVDVLDYGADVSIRPEPVSNQSVSNSNVQLKNAAGNFNQPSNNPPTKTPDNSFFNGTGPRFDYTSDPNKARDGNFYTGQKIGNSSGYPTSIFEAGNNKCDRYVDSIGWKYRDLYKDSNGNRKFGWSLSIIPSKCSKEKARQPTPTESWSEVYKKAPLCTENIIGKGCNIQWDQNYNTPLYWSMHDQYVCHTDYATSLGKKEFNLEPDRRRVGQVWTYFNGCNPDYLIK